MIGTIFNVCMILVGSFVGSYFKKGIKPAYNEILTQALGLAAIAIGLNAVVQHMPKSHYPVLFIVSLAVGGLIGLVSACRHAGSVAVPAQGLAWQTLPRCGKRLVGEHMWHAAGPIAGDLCRAVAADCLASA